MPSRTSSEVVSSGLPNGHPTFRTIRVEFPPPPALAMSSAPGMTWPVALRFIQKQTYSKIVFSGNVAFDQPAGRFHQRGVLDPAARRLGVAAEDERVLVAGRDLLLDRECAGGHAGPLRLAHGGGVLHRAGRGFEGEVDPVMELGAQLQVFGERRGFDHANRAVALDQANRAGGGVALEVIDGGDSPWGWPGSRRSRPRC